jgi:hypothetical protein
MLSALHTGQYGPAEWPERSRDRAAAYAARLVIAHPGSAAARLLGSPRQ